jgi:hypothetical protein
MSAPDHIYCKLIHQIGENTAMHQPKSFLHIVWRFILFCVPFAVAVTIFSIIFYWDTANNYGIVEFLVTRALLILPGFSLALGVPFGLVLGLVFQGREIQIQSDNHDALLQDLQTITHNHRWWLQRTNDQLYQIPSPIALPGMKDLSTTFIEFYDHKVRFVGPIFMVSPIRRQFKGHIIR